jgi:hypothetical protein
MIQWSCLFYHFKVFWDTFNLLSFFSIEQFISNSFKLQSSIVFCFVKNWSSSIVRSIDFFRDFLTFSQLSLKSTFDLMHFELPKQKRFQIKTKIQFMKNNRFFHNRPGWWFWPPKTTGAGQKAQETSPFWLWVKCEVNIMVPHAVALTPAPHSHQHTQTHPQDS